MQDHEAIRELARSRTRESLRTSPSFMSMDVAEQKSLFQDIYKSTYRDLARTYSNDQGKNSRSKSVSQAMAAGDLIDDDRHTNDRIEQAGELAGEFMSEVDFPGFVRDLLKGVFDASLEVTLQQMASFQELLKTATASVSKFVNAIDDTAAFGYLAENNEDEFSIDFSDNDTDSAGNPAAILIDGNGEPLDIGDNEVKSRIMDAKIAMAKEQRALLREMLLLGVTRLVIEKGNVKASVLFDIKAGEIINKKDKAAMKDQLSSSRSADAGTGLIGKLVGGGNVGHTRSRRKSKISISSVDSAGNTELAAKIAGSVDITFKSDYFKLDNFAQMYGPVTDADRQDAGGGQGGGGGN